MSPTTRLAVSILAAAIAAFPSIAFANPAPVTPASETAARPSMEFRLVEGRSAIGLTRWIQASGPITDETPGRFRTFADAHDIGGLTVALDSFGGDLDGGMQLGRAFRSAGVDTLVGRTVSGPSDSARLAVLVTDNVECNSACALAFVGGHNRRMTADAIMALHQFNSGSLPPAEHFRTAQRVTAVLAVYLQEMGIDMRMLALAAAHPYGSSFHRLSLAQAEALRIATPLTYDEARFEPVPWAFGNRPDQPLLYRRNVARMTAERRIDGEVLLWCMPSGSFGLRARLVLLEAGRDEVIEISQIDLNSGRPYARWRADEGQTIRLGRERDVVANFELQREALTAAAERGRLSVEVSGPATSLMVSLGDGLREALPQLVAACDAQQRVASAAR